MRIQAPYTAQEHQARIHASGARYKLFLGGVGSGKTLTGLHELVFAAQDNPRADGLICSPTVPMFRDVVLPTLADWLPSQCYTYHRSELFIEWHPTGRRWFVRTATSPDRASGLNIGYGWYDEAAIVQTDKLWRIMMARLRQACPFPRIIVTTTPNGLNWVPKWFGEQQARDPRSVMIVRCKTSDNKRLPDDFEAGLRAAYGEEYAQQMLDAMVLSLMGLAWPIAPIHLSLTYDEMRARSIVTLGGVDWGHTAPAALVVGGLDHEGRWMIRRCWYKRGKTRAEIADEAAKITEEENVEAWFIDHDPEGEQQMKERGLKVYLAEKAVESGVMHVRSQLAVRRDGLPHFFVERQRCKDWLREQSAYSFPEDEEEPEGANGDHSMDATRYMCFTPTTLHPYQQRKLGLDRVAGFSDVSNVADVMAF